jgi:CPA1 family monovalent cation:H+ antiporter
VATGVACGYAGTLLLARLRDPILATIGSFLLGWAAYIGAEALGFSGVLSTVACGLIVGWRQHTILTAQTRFAATTTWQTVTFVLESLVFILIGLSLRGVLGRLNITTGSVFSLVLPTLAIIAAVILARFAWVLPASYLSRAIFPRLRRQDPYPPVEIPILIRWAGMRGVVSLAAALALPTEFPGRDFILAASFAVILVTVLVQGTTLAPLIRLLRIDRFIGGSQLTLRESEARARIAKAQLNAIQRASAMQDGTQRHPRLLEQYTYRARAAERFSSAEQELESHRQAHFAAILAAVEAARSELVLLHRRGEIHDTVLHTLEAELDLEEMTARRYTAEPA